MDAGSLSGSKATGDPGLRAVLCAPRGAEKQYKDAALNFVQPTRATVVFLFAAAPSLGGTRSPVTALRKP
jgi:hypothetical protein